ncbi:MAG TPA: N-acetylmuramoyl-L-alanine amidase [Patescibacteria group bacterium]|nr:N-acetylmuramoyl-L-alanine amidase [Patescibacteria group bacterium]
MKLRNKIAYIFILISLIFSASLVSVPAKAQSDPQNIPNQKIEYSFIVSSTEYISKISKSDFAFTGVASSWNKDIYNPQIYLRSGKTESSLSDWQIITPESDMGPDNTPNANFYYGDVFNANKDSYLQYKAVFDAQDIGKNFSISLSIFDASAAPLITKISADSAGLGPKIISRSAWGANESYMNWTPEYSEVKAFIIHHTAGDAGSGIIDQASLMRNIYYGHAVSNGWGDIGYNYVIDFNGNIYEGRTGGGSVVAGHTTGYNYGTIGISVMGDYTTREFTEQQTQALADLIAYKSFQNGIDPTGMVYLKDKTISTVVGHRDLNATLCPGTNIYTKITDIKNRAKTKLATYPSKQVNAQFISADGGTKIFGGDTSKFNVSIKNNGNAPILRGGSHRINIVSNGGSVVANLANSGRSIEPGETVAISVDVSAPTTTSTVNQAFSATIDGALIAGGNFSTTFNIVMPQYRAKFNAKSADLVLQPGQKGTVWVEFKNVGSENWQSNTGLKLVTKFGNSSSYYTSGDWESGSSVGTFDQLPVTAGSIGRISFQITAPSTAGNYRESFKLTANPLLEGGSDLEVSFGLVNQAPSGQLISTTEQKVYSKNISDYSYQIITQSPYLDMVTGDKKEVFIEIKNTGKTNWYKDTLRLGTLRVADRASIFADSSWKSANRIEMQQTKVAPGENARFQFTATAPNQAGSFKEYFGFVADGVGWMSDIGLYWAINISAPAVPTSSSSTSSDPYAMQLIDKGNDISVAKGIGTNVNIKVKNNGAATWKKGVVRLGTFEPMDRVSTFADTNWLSTNRIAFAETEVAPGGIANFNFTINSSKDVGNYIEKFKLVAENIAWFGVVIPINISITNPPVVSLPATPKIGDAFAYVSQSPHLTLNTGDTVQVWIDLKNTGDTNWEKNSLSPVRLATNNPRDRTSAFISSNRISLNDNIVYPGNTTRFSFSITAPGTPGVYKEYFTLVRDGVSWFNDIGIYWQFTVNKSTQQDTQVTTNTPTTGTLTSIPAGTQTVRISASGPFIVVNGPEVKLAEGGAGDYIDAFYKDGKHYFNYKGQTILADGWVRVVPWAAQTILTLDNYSDRPAWNTSINDNKFKGAIEVRYSTKNSRLWVIDDLNIEDYLKGVSEPLESGPYEYIKAAVIAERSYIYYHLQRGGRWPDDFITLKNSRNGNGDDQIYQGYNFSARAVNIPRAVSDTAGQVVTYNGNPVLTPYYTQSDGRTRSISEVWGSKQSDYPWLVSVPDPWSAGYPMLGHGVGMSGRGARGLAAEGKSYQDVLKYFYTGTGIGNISTNRNIRIGIYYIEQ